jgi:hypothetical protein
MGGTWADMRKHMAFLQALFLSRPSHFSSLSFSRLRIPPLNSACYAGYILLHSGFAVQMWRQPPFTTTPRWWLINKLAA